MILLLLFADINDDVVRHRHCNSSSGLCSCFNKSSSSKKVVVVTVVIAVVSKVVTI
jgi:hypothetical protein